MPVVDVQLACDPSKAPARRVLATWVQRALQEAREESVGRAEVAVRVVEAEEMRSLNREYRGRDYATNVLSFPAGDIAGLPGDAVRLLGDIVICADVVNSEAAEQDKSREDHWAHMLVHGSLHLLGYDHRHDDEAAAMEALEKRVLGRYGLTDPYGESI